MTLMGYLGLMVVMFFFWVVALPEQAETHFEEWRLWLKQRRVKKRVDFEYRRIIDQLRVKAKKQHVAREIVEEVINNHRGESLRRLNRTVERLVEIEMEMEAENNKRL